MIAKQFSKNKTKTNFARVLRERENKRNLTEGLYCRYEKYWLPLIAELSTKNETDTDFAPPIGTTSTQRPTMRRAKLSLWITQHESRPHSVGMALFLLLYGFSKQNIPVHANRETFLRNEIVFLLKLAERNEI